MDLCSNKNKSAFFNGCMGKLMDLSYKNWYLMGDCNEVVCPQQARTLTKGIKMMQGKLPKYSSK